MKLSQSDATDKITRGVEKKIAKPKKDEKVPRNAVGRPSEKLQLANLLRDKRAARRANKKEIAELRERLKAIQQRIQYLRHAIATLRAAQANALMASMPAPAA
ncbi:hypothetical protein PRIPAC_83593 [Pristionchus pacificus]|uniref:Uncharacterized protein n=1 Tax=Pristionchus pacificus TaxID=54126 RepID=A0A2A6BM08_PRIPA|nr:hypothetical protein PRIPAC_83593 [Pristionchus pacificus]|eukprot:PDM66939.1 hypothetical protein PRIPAC_48356 [Pristionchus pacificus]